jgi:rare lipoprotein A
MLFRFLLSASIVAGALTPAAVEAKSSCGLASWYGPGFHGNLTASGERFNSQALTAASTRLPYGSLVRVRNQDNGRSVVVRINDYGPVVPGRILDLSKGSFSKIASSGQGLARICYTII